MNKMSETGVVRGFKVFNPDWTCNPNGKVFQYEVGGIYEEAVTPKVCKSGFHFCKKAADCFNYYNFDPKNKVAEVIALGEVVSDSDGSKYCTNKIQIVREIPWQELLEMVNTGKGCTGRCNSGNGNSGNWNSGNRNSGDWNSGNGNSGDCNSGNGNSGDCNSGDWNSGNRNSGNRNSGDWNKASFSSGCFNTIEPKIHLFNKPSKWTYRNWADSRARYLLNQIPANVLEYVSLSDMTDEEKAGNPEAETTGGYLKVLDNSECAVIWWRGLTDSDKRIITDIPNFDKAIFKEITGIDVDRD